MGAHCVSRGHTPTPQPFAAGELVISENRTFALTIRQPSVKSAVHRALLLDIPPHSPCHSGSIPATRTSVGANCPAQVAGSDGRGLLPLQGVAGHAYVASPAFPSVTELQGSGCVRVHGSPG